MNVPPKGSNAFRLGAYFETLKVSQQPVPNLTVRIAEGAYYVGGNTLVEFAGGNTAAMVPPGAGLAVWVLVALTANASVQLVYGVPAATSSPPAPAVPAGYIPLAYVYLINGTTAVTNDMIFDERPLWSMQTSFVPLAGATMTGPLILNGNPTAANGAATKSYVDSQDALHPTFTDMNNGLLTKADVAGTPSDTFVLNNDWVGAPSTNVFFGVDRGSQPNTYIRWNEGTDTWELTNDGTSYSPISTTGALGAYLPLAGGTMLGALTLAADPAAPLQAATKQYVDATVTTDAAFFVAKTGSTMTGVLVHPLGTAANPTVVFGADVTSGLYSAGAGEIDFAIAGVKKASVTAAGITVFSGFYTPGTGGAAAPEHSFTNDPTTGMYRSGAGAVAMAAAGVHVATFDVTGMSVTGNVSATGGLSVTGPATVDLNMGGFKVANMGAPTLGTDATTKTYVDTAVGTKVNKADTFALTGDVVVSPAALTGPANSFAATLATSGVTAGSYGSASAVAVVTFDAKGRATTAATTPIAITGAAVTVGGFTSGHVVSLDASGHPVDSGTALTALALDAAVVHKTDTLALTGDVTVPASALTGPANSFAATLANTAVTAGSYGSASSVGTFTVDAKGRLTAAASTVIAITGAAVTVGGFTSGHVVSLDASGHPVDSALASTNLFLADGTVPATGDFNINDHNITNVTFLHGPTASNLTFNAQNANDIAFTLNNSTVGMTIKSTGSVAVGVTAPVTTATDGFPYIPVTTGTPTGVPTAIPGYVPMVFDSSANKLWAYIGGTWLSVTFA